ncbi:GNAT family N-acetyltransferase [Halovivax limisalsi]|uniref:GNAT family N-acetyltransferase n=1 Tax=Halovivax limisalsi TaxID=1453760 RepID=UPI001FFC4D8E|nr:N-acetyltransferase [Halovivax limisalsi]
MTDGTVDVTVRPARPDEAPAIRTVCATAWRRAYDGLLPDAYVEANLETFYTTDWLRAEIRAPTDAGRWLVAASADDSAAPAVCGAGRGSSPTNGTCEVSTLYVHPEAQGLGVGSALLEAITARQRADCAGHPPEIDQCVEVFDGHAQAIGFYEHHGFERVSTRRTDVVDGVDPDHRTVRLTRGC